MHDILIDCLYSLIPIIWIYYDVLYKVSRHLNTYERRTILYRIFLSHVLRAVAFARETSSSTGSSANPFFLLVDSSRSMKHRRRETDINFPRFASYRSCLTSTVVGNGWRSDGGNGSSTFRLGIRPLFLSSPFFGEEVCLLMRDVWILTMCVFFF